MSIYLYSTGTICEEKKITNFIGKYSFICPQRSLIEHMSVQEKQFYQMRKRT